jgi:hypothetical protein
MQSIRTTTDTVVRYGGARPRRARPRRDIGIVGTTARIVVGLVLVGSVLAGHLTGDFQSGPWLLGLIGFPTAVLVWQWSRARRGAPRLRATGPLAVIVNIAVVAALYATPWYAPALSVPSDAALLLYGSSMLLAAVRGDAGCEVLAIPNWLLHYDDQIGCLVFSPIDRLERRLQRRPVVGRTEPDNC